MTAASQLVEGSMDLQPINYDPIYLETIEGQKKQRVYDIGSKGVTNMQSQSVALMRQMGHRVLAKHPPVGQPTTDPPANDEDDDLGLDD